MLWHFTCGTVNICELWNVDVVEQVERKIVTGCFRSRFSSRNARSRRRLRQVGAPGEVQSGRMTCGTSPRREKERRPFVSGGNVARFSLSDCETWSRCCSSWKRVVACAPDEQVGWRDPSDSGSFGCQEGLSPGRRLESGKKA